MDNRQTQLNRANHVLTAMGVDTRNAKVMDRTHYTTFDAKGKGSIVEILDSNTKKLTGVTSFDSNKFNKGRHFVIDAIRVLVEVTATKAEEGTWTADADKAVVNSEIVISQDEDLLILPVSDLLCKKVGEAEDGGFRSVGSAPVLMPEKDINISWRFPNGVSVDTATTQFVRIEYRGFEFFTN